MAKINNGVLGAISGKGGLVIGAAGKKGADQYLGKVEGQ